ncbi:MAG: glycosyltransferase [Nibricoccus sp.]
MIYFDLSRTKNAKHHSGLTRVSNRLAREFGSAVQPVAIAVPGRGPAECAAAFQPKVDDWWLTAELFSEHECPGMWKFIRERPCKLAAIFHDAIPLRFPHTTWPQSVARQPEYMKMLAEFDFVFADSEVSRQDLLSFWRWQNVEPRATVETLPLGSDFSGQSRVQRPADKNRSGLLCIGILEPRKNQAFLLDVCERLWRENIVFDLHLIGRVNPHFGKPVLQKIEAMRQQWRGLHFHAAANDAVVTSLYGKVRASVFPTVAEGCGLPLLEALWQGIPCICSDLPVLRENTEGGGCLAVPVDDLEAWAAALQRVLTDDAFYSGLVDQAIARPLPLWSETAKTILGRLAASNCGTSSQS